MITVIDETIILVLLLLSPKLLVMKEAVLVIMSKVLEIPLFRILMTETSNLTPEQKEKNKKYILTNLGKYILESRGSFYSQALEEAGKAGEDYFFISSELVKDYQEVKEKVIDDILKDRSKWNKCIEEEFTYELIKIIVLSEKEDWELTFFSFGFVQKKIKHKPSGMELDMFSWNPAQRHFLVGELGYRGISYDGILSDAGTLIWGEHDKKRNDMSKRIENQINKQSFELRKTIPKSLSPKPKPETKQKKEEPVNPAFNPKNQPDLKHEPTSHEDSIPPPKQSTPQELKNNLNQA